MALSAGECIVCPSDYIQSNTSMNVAVVGYMWLAAVLLPDYYTQWRYFLPLSFCAHRRMCSEFNVAEILWEREREMLVWSTAVQHCAPQNLLLQPLNKRERESLQLRSSVLSLVFCLLLRHSFILLSKCAALVICLFITFFFSLSLTTTTTWPLPPPFLLHPNQIFIIITTTNCNYHPLSFFFCSQLLNFLCLIYWRLQPAFSMWQSSSYSSAHHNYHHHHQPLAAATSSATMYMDSNVSISSSLNNHGNNLRTECWTRPLDSWWKGQVDKPDNPLMPVPSLFSIYFSFYFSNDLSPIQMTTNDHHYHFGHRLSHCLSVFVSLSVSKSHNHPCARSTSQLPPPLPSPR